RRTLFLCHLFFFSSSAPPLALHSFPTRRSSDLRTREIHDALKRRCLYHWIDYPDFARELAIVRAKVPRAQESLSREIVAFVQARSEEHTSELQSRENLVCRLLLEKKKKK